MYNSPKKSHFCATFAHSMHIFKYFHTFFKFFPANTNIYQNSYSLQCGHLISFGTKCLMSLQYGFPSGRYVINCAFDQTIAVNVNCLSFACLFLFPTGTQYPAGSPYFRSQWQSTSYGKNPLQKRLKCLCGIQNKPNKHYTVLKLIIFIHTLLNSGHRKISP